MRAPFCCAAKDDAQPAEGQPSVDNGSEQQVSGWFESKDEAEAKIDDADKTQEQKQPEPSEQSDEKTTGASAHVEVNSEADQKVEPAQEPDVEADKKKKQAKAKAMLAARRLWLFYCFAVELSIMRLDVKSARLIVVCLSCLLEGGCCFSLQVRERNFQRTARQERGYKLLNCLCNLRLQQFQSDWKMFLPD